MPPGLVQIAVERGRGRAADRGPMCHPLPRKMKQRNRVEAREQHPVERAYRRDEIILPLGAQQRCDHRIDRGALHAHVVAGAGLVGGGRAPIERLLVAGRQRLVPAILDHVEIKGETTTFELHRVDDAHARRDARALKALREQQREPLLVTRRDHELEGEGATGLALDQLRAAQVVAGGGKQRQRALERGAVAAGAVAHRRRPGAVEDVRTH